MSIRDLTWEDWSVILWTILFFLTCGMLFPICTEVCDKLDIPYKLMLSVSSIGFRLELNLTLSILYLALMYHLPRYLAHLVFYKF